MLPYCFAHSNGVISCMWLFRALSRLWVSLYLQNILWELGQWHLTWWAGEVRDSFRRKWDTSSHPCTYSFWQDAIRISTRPFQALDKHALTFTKHFELSCLVIAVRPPTRPIQRMPPGVALQRLHGQLSVRTSSFSLNPRRSLAKIT